MGDPSSIPGSGKSPREGNGNTLQYSCLENSKDQRSLVGYSPCSRRVTHDWAANRQEGPLLEDSNSHSWYIEWRFGTSLFTTQLAKRTPTQVKCGACIVPGVRWMAQILKISWHGVGRGNWKNILMQGMPLPIQWVVPAFEIHERTMITRTIITIAILQGIVLIRCRQIIRNWGPLTSNSGYVWEPESLFRQLLGWPKCSFLQIFHKILWKNPMNLLVNPIRTVFFLHGIMIISEGSLRIHKFLRALETLNVQPRWGYYTKVKTLARKALDPETLHKDI